jgi:PAS domain S-box-containing protein
MEQHQLKWSATMADHQEGSGNLLTRWFRFPLRAKSVAVLAFPISALLLALLSIYWMEGSVRDTERRVSRAYDTRAEIMQVHSSLLDAETAVGGYLATGQASFISAFDSARASMQRSFARLPELVAGDPAAIGELSDIQGLATEEIRILGQLRTPSSVPAGGGIADRGKAVMGEVQARLTLLNDYEERRFTEARYRRDLARRRLFRAVILCGILGPVGALLLHLLIAGQMVRRIRLVEENARRLARGLPLNPLGPGNDEIADLARQLESAAYLLRDRERELRERERRYRDLFNQAPIPYVETDREGVIRRFNEAVCDLLKCAPDRILGRHAWEFLAPEQQEERRTVFLERIASGSESGPFESDYFLEDGACITVEIRENLIRNDFGEITGVCRSMMDVTERNLAAMAARKVEQYALELRNRNEQLARALDAARSATVAKSRFLAGVSHELRTPLNGIIGFSELMQDGKLGPVSEEHRECLGDILTSARHLLQLINDILDLSKVEAGKMEFRPEPSEIDRLVYEVRDVVRPLAERKKLRLATDVPAGLAALVDPSRFKQVLYNYLSNAVKFTPDGGSVTIRVSVQAERFRLEVEDTGIGIPADEISRLFQEFQQLPNSRKAEQGTGLGLALTRHIVEAQGGRVAVRSAPGRGSVFSAELPLHPTPAVVS